MNPFTYLLAALLLAKAGAQLWLARLNRRHTRAHAQEVPEPFRGFLSPDVYSKSVAYTLAKNGLQQVAIVADLLGLGLVLFSGGLPRAFLAFTRHAGSSLPAQAAFLLLVAGAIGLASWPLEWYGQFRLETRFGFNATTNKTWWLVRLKGTALGVGLGYPLLLLLLHLAEWSGRGWWLWVWASTLTFQALVLVLAPVLILPLFNKFTPLPEGSLRQRLLALAAQTRFSARNIQVMDGSKRSRHSNAFFTGFGRFRKIVLFDTLIEQLAETELAAVLAHEIGHYRRKHIVKFLIAGALGSLAGCSALSLLADAPWFYGALGFGSGTPRSIAFLLFGLLAGTVTFWLSPVASFWSRRFEYQADAFAAETMGETTSLIGALRKLNEKNLSHLTPHPLYSGFYYSHPTLLEREQALTHDGGRNPDP